MFGGDVTNKLLDQNSLANARPAEQADLAAGREGGEQVDDLETGDKLVLADGLLVKRGGRATDGPCIGGLNRLSLVVDGLAEQVEQPPERGRPDRDGNRLAAVGRAISADEAVGGRHRNAPDEVVAQVLRGLDDEIDIPICVVGLNLDGVVEFW